MNFRIRCAVLIMNDQKLLLVQHVDPFTSKDWWVPPGGGLEKHDGSILSCAVREVSEETGLDISPGKLVYLREFIEGSKQTYQLELYFLAERFQGELIKSIRPGSDADDGYIQQVAWLSREEIKSLSVFPLELKADFWEDLAAGFPAVRYLGKQSD